MTRIEKRLFEDRGPWWHSFLMGAATGVVVGLVLRHPRGSESDDEDTRGPRWSRLRGAWNDAVDGASEGLSNARQLVSPGPELDEEALEEMLAKTPGSSGCRLRFLSDGIVEVVGSCASEEALTEILDALAAAPGVEVVVNRVWTDDSSSPGGSSGNVPAH